MRYREEGGVHLDFYRTLNATIRYLSEKYGQAFLRKTFRDTAFGVYRDMLLSLKRGSCRELIQHWEYFLRREGNIACLKTAGAPFWRLKSAPQSII